MSILSRYQSPSSFTDRFRRNLGFDARDPDRRYPVQNDEPDRILATRARGQDARAALLLGARHGKPDPDRSRGFGLLAPVLGYAGWPEPSLADQLINPSDAVAPVLDVSAWGHRLSEFVAGLPPIDWTQPGWGLGLGAALLLTQVLALRQRSRLLRTVARIVDPQQPDLFPETLDKISAGIPGSAHTWRIDAASRQGKVRKENQDAFAVLKLPDSTSVLIVCDGAGGIAGGREAALSAVAAIKGHLNDRWQSRGSLVAADLEGAIAAARLSSELQSPTGVTTALVVLLQQDQIHFATLGDGAIAVVWPDGMVGPVQVPHHTAGAPSNIINAFIGSGCQVSPRTGSLRLEPGSLVLAMTDGASDLFPFEEFALERDNYRDVTGMGDRLLAELEAARDPDTRAYLHHDNMTLALARLETGGADDHAH